MNLLLLFLRSFYCEGLYPTINAKAVAEAEAKTKVKLSFLFLFFLTQMTAADHFTRLEHKLEFNFALLGYRFTSLCSMTSFIVV